VNIRTFIQPGKNQSNIEGFDKNIEKIPSWPEEQIKGAFEQSRPYTVRLFFVETEKNDIGKRLFDVYIQEKPVLESFDIVKEADGPNRLVIKEFKDVKIKDDLKIALTPTAKSQAAPLLCGIEIIADGW
jgi:hypothetical protein